MDMFELLKFAPLAIGLALAFYILKQYNVGNFNIGKLLLYFVGIFVTFIFVGWFVDTYLLGWANDRLTAVDTSTEFVEFENRSKRIISDALDTDTGAVQTVPTTPPNQVIVVTPTPPQSGGGGPVIAGSATTYIVVAGDTLFGIARRFGVTVNDIMVTNQLTSSTIYPGQVLTIPAPSK